MSLYNKLINKKENLALVGLGYVGMLIAVASQRRGLMLSDSISTKKRLNCIKTELTRQKKSAMKLSEQLQCNLLWMKKNYRTLSLSLLLFLHL